MLELGYPESVVFYFHFLKFMLVELILAACTECGRPTFSSCRVWQWLRLGFFTALHAMQTRSSDENSVRLSVRPSVRPSHAACIVTKR